MLLSLIVFIAILSVLVFVHELGHFAVAKWVGMKVDEFAIGFPPRLWTKKKGETNYSINAVPLGGYVRIHGENPDSEDEDPHSFNNRPVAARMAVIVAGVAMNLIFAFVVLTIAFSVGFVSVGQKLTDYEGAQTVSSQVAISSIEKGYPAEKSGIMPGDLLIGITDSSGSMTKIQDTDQLMAFNKSHQESGDLALKVSVEREGQQLEYPVTANKEGYALGVGISPFNVVKIPYYMAPVAASKEIGYIMGMTWDALKGFGQKLFTKAELDPNVSGPVGIFNATSSSLKQGAIPTIFLIVALSINLALLNILPIPALDGGKLVFLLTELVFRRRVIHEKIENWLAVFGISFLLLLISVISIRDIINLFK